jgi:hypothetical protein
LKTERSAAQKLATYKRACRENWHKSPMYWQAYNRAKVRPGILVCEECKSETDRRLIEIDHIAPVVEPGQDPLDIALWSFRLNCPGSALKVLCSLCHGKKTACENRRRVKRGVA